MISIPQEMKPILNVLIRYYRRTYCKQDNRYSAKNFVLDEDNIPICTVSSLSLIENNKRYAKEVNYHFFINNLGFTFTPCLEINNLFPQVNAAILKHAEFNYSKKITRLIDETRNLVEPYKNSIIYCEYLEMYEILHLYYSDVSFNKILIDKYLSLYEIIDNSIKPIFLSIAYHYYTRVNIDDEISINIINRSSSLTSETIITKHLLNIFYMRNHRFIEQKKQGFLNVSYCKIHNNKFYLVKAYNLTAFLYSDSEPKKAIKYLNLYRENFDHENDIKENYDLTLRNIEHIHFFNKDYVEVISFYKKHLYNNIHFLESFFMFLIFSFNHTTMDKKEVKRIILVVKKHCTEHSAFHQALISFYYNSYFSIPFREVSKSIEMLLDNKELFVHQEIMREVLISEIKNACHKNNAYSTYHSVMKCFQ